MCSSYFLYTQKKTRILHKCNNKYFKLYFQPRFSTQMNNSKVITRLEKNKLLPSSADPKMQLMLAFFTTIECKVDTGKTLKEGINLYTQQVVNFMSILRLFMKAAIKKPNNN